MGVLQPWHLKLYMLVLSVDFGVLSRAKGHANVTMAYSQYASMIIWTTYELFGLFTDVYVDVQARRGLKIVISSLKMLKTAVHEHRQQVRTSF